MTTAFKFVDSDGSGGLDPAEFRAFMRILRLDVSGAPDPATHSVKLLMWMSMFARREYPHGEQLAN